MYSLTPIEQAENRLEVIRDYQVGHISRTSVIEMLQHPYRGSLTLEEAITYVDKVK